MVTAHGGAPWSVVPPDTTYLNFDLVIERADAGSYRARVVASPGGDAERIFLAPFTPDDFEALADQLDPSRRKRKMDAPHLSLAKDMGGRLHDAILCDDVKVSLARARDEAERQRAAGVRIRLHLDAAPELAILPWEFMFDPDPKVARFLALAEDTPLVRYVDLPEMVRPLKITPPIRVLGIVSNPADDRYPELEVEKEWRSLEEALRQPIDDGRLVLHRAEKATVSSLLDTLAESDSNILHFIGHGRFDEDHQDGLLAFEGERGGVHEVSAERLGALLYNEKSLRLVVLNACEGGRSSATDPYAGMAQTLVRMRVPAVVAMQFEITDRAAIAFARQFYKGIALGRPVDTAITDARMAIYQLVNEVEWATPVLYMRAPDGRIFDVAEVAPVSAPPPTPLPTTPLVETPIPVTTRGGARTRAMIAVAPTQRTLSCVLTMAVMLAVGGTLASRYLGPGSASPAGSALPTVPTVAASEVPTVAPTAVTRPPLVIPSLIPIPNMKVTATIPAGQRPDGIAVDEKAGRIYVVNGDAGQLRILDANTKGLVGTVVAAGQPVDVAVDPSLDRVYVSQFKANTVAVFDGKGGIRGTIPVASGPFAVAVHPDTHRVYVAGQVANAVSIIDAASLKVVKTISVGLLPSGIAINSRSDRAYVANLRSRSVTVIDTVREVVIGTIGLDAAPGRVAVALGRDLVLTTNPDDDSVTVISGQTQRVVTKVAVGKHPLGILVDPARDRAYAAVDGSGTVAVIDLVTNTLDHVVSVGSNPARFAYNAGSRQLYVTNFGSDTISVIQ